MNVLIKVAAGRDVSLLLAALPEMKRIAESGVFVDCYLVYVGDASDGSREVDFKAEEICGLVDGLVGCGSATIVGFNVMSMLRVWGRERYAEGYRQGEVLAQKARLEEMRVLHLTLKRKWFKMIVGYEKREEYREIKPYWTRRLEGRSYDAVRFRNGYAADSPAAVVELRDVYRGLGYEGWGAPPQEEVYVLVLGKILIRPGE